MWIRTENPREELSIDARVLDTESGLVYEKFMVEGKLVVRVYSLHNTKLYAIYYDGETARSFWKIITAVGRS